MHFLKMNVKRSYRLSIDAVGCFHMQMLFLKVSFAQVKFILVLMKIYSSKGVENHFIIYFSYYTIVNKVYDKQLIIKDFQSNFQVHYKLQDIDRLLQ